MSEKHATKEPKKRGGSAERETRARISTLTEGKKRKKNKSWEGGKGSRSSDRGIFWCLSHRDDRRAGSSAEPNG